MYNPQLNDDGTLKHLLSIEGLPKKTLLQILDTAESFVGVAERDVKKVPLLRGKTVCNLFFENSTRTRTTFEIAAKRLSADVINLNVNTSSQSKGEAILDTINNLIAMHADMFVVRHNESGAAHLIAQHVPEVISVINAGGEQRDYVVKDMRVVDKNDVAWLHEDRDVYELSLVTCYPFNAIVSGGDLRFVVRAVSRVTVSA